MSMGETTTRLARSSWPSRNGANIGGHGSPVPCPASSWVVANHSSTRAMNSGSRSRRLS